MAKSSLVNREMSHTHTYIYVTQITKWGLKIQLNYSKYIGFFSSLTLLLHWSTCVTQKGPSCTNKEKISAHRSTGFPQNFAPQLTTKFWGTDNSLPIEWFCRNKNEQAIGWLFFLPPLWIKLSPSLLEEATPHHLAIRSKEWSDNQTLCKKRWVLHQQSNASLQPYAHSERRVQSSYLQAKPVGIPLFGGSAGAKGKGLPAEGCDGETFAATTLKAPENHGGPHQGSKDIVEVHWWVSLRQRTAFQQQRAQLCKESLAALALQEKLSEPTLLKVAADLCSVAARVKHEGLIFRKWEA